MYVIPFVYFSALLYRVYKKRKAFDIVCLTIAIYTISSLFTILMSFDDGNFGLPVDYSFSITGVLVYCILLTITILPFFSLSNNAFANLNPLRNDKIIRCVSVLSAVYLFIYSYMSYNDIVNLMSGNIAQYRVDLLNGTLEDNWLQKMNPVIRFPFALCNMLISCPWILQMLAFFCLIIQRMKKRYVFMLLLGSLTGPVAGALTLDRSRTIYWIISAIVCFYMFKQSMDEKQKRQIYKIASFFGLILLSYFVFITISRFGEIQNGVQGSLISYIGSPFVNFVYLFDRSYLDFYSLHIIFPFTHEYIIKDGFVGSLSIQTYMSDHSNLYYNVFSTFIGQIYLTAGFFYCVLFLLIYSFVTKHIVNRINVANNNLLRLYILLALNSVISLGLFNHYYAEASRTFAVVVFYFIIKYMSKK